jgi:hypothetical protein
VIIRTPKLTTSSGTVDAPKSPIAQTFDGTLPEVALQTPRCELRPHTATHSA